MRQKKISLIHKPPPVQANDLRPTKRRMKEEIKEKIKELRRVDEIGVCPIGVIFSLNPILLIGKQLNAVNGIDEEGKLLILKYEEGKCQQFQMSTIPSVIGIIFGNDSIEKTFPSTDFIIKNPTICNNNNKSYKLNCSVVTDWEKEINELNETKINCIFKICNKQTGYFFFYKI